MSDLNCFLTIGSKIEHVEFQLLIPCPVSHFFVNVELTNYSLEFGVNRGNLGR
jgi:hypothetical protein